MTEPPAVRAKYADVEAAGARPLVDRDSDRDAKRLRAAASLFVADSERLRTITAGFRKGQLVFESEVRGWSMTGTLPGRSRIRIRCSEAAGHSVGDVIAVQQEGTLVVHRIVYCGRRRVTRDYVITRGDSTLLADPPACGADVVGAVIAVRNGASWQPVPGAPPRTRKFLSAALLFTLAAALEIRPRLATTLARGLWRLKARCDRWQRRAA